MTNSRRKGKNGELEFALEIQDWLGIHPKRNLNQARAGGFDLQLTYENHSFAVEVKRYKTFTQNDIESAWAQALNQATTLGHCPLLAYRQDRQQWRVTLPAFIANPMLPRSLEWDYTITMTVPGFACLLRELSDHGDHRHQAA